MNRASPQGPSRGGTAVTSAAVATPQRNPPVSRGIGERPARDRAEGAQPQPPPRLGLRALVGPPQSGRQREKVLLRGTPGALRPPTAAPHAIPRSAATPSTRPSALAGPPQSGRQRRRSGKQCLGRREHAPNAIPRSPGDWFTLLGLRYSAWYPIRPSRVNRVSRQGPSRGGPTTPSHPLGSASGARRSPAKRETAQKTQHTKGRSSGTSGPGGVPGSAARWVRGGDER